MTKKKDDARPIAELDFYPGRLVARVRRLSLSYRRAAILITIPVVFLIGLNFDQAITLIKTLIEILK